MFGRLEDPNGAYAAVIPCWIGQLLTGERCVINGDGETRRDFCYIQNVIQANILAATVLSEQIASPVYNIAYGGRMTLNELYMMIRAALSTHRPAIASLEPIYVDFRPGDGRHSQADIARARQQLGYNPSHSVAEGLQQAAGWYIERHASAV